MREPLHVILPLAIVAALAAVSALAMGVARAEPPIFVTNLLYRVPRTEAEAALAHEQSRSAALQLADGLPLDGSDEVRRVWYDVKLDNGKADGGKADGGKADGTKIDGASGYPIERSLPYEYTRRGVLCFGTRMSSRDRADLPLITSAAILDRVNTNFVSLQVRVHRDAAGGEPYLHYRPEAAVGVYGKSEASIAFAALQQNALRDVRGLGLFVKRGEALSPSRLRTLVIVNKGQVVLEDTTTGEIDLNPSLELMFVRARPQAVTADELELHAFATSGDRRRLHYLKPFALPAKLDECGIQSTVRVTEYQLAGQYPSARAARQIHYRAIVSLPVERLNQYASAAGWSGDALDNLTETLDAIIDGKIAVDKLADDKVADDRATGTPVTAGAIADERK